MTAKRNRMVRVSSIQISWLLFSEGGKKTTKSKLATTVPGNQNITSELGTRLFLSKCKEGTKETCVVLPDFRQQLPVIDGFVVSHWLSLAASPLPPHPHSETEVGNGCGRYTMVIRYS